MTPMQSFVAGFLCGFRLTSGDEAQKRLGDFQVQNTVYRMNSDWDLL
jgi:hypothetical protein